MSHLKVIDTSQGPIHKFTNLKRKLYNCNANIYFNQEEISSSKYYICHQGTLLSS